MRLTKSMMFLASLAIVVASCGPKLEQPSIEARNSEILTVKGYQFKDLNKNGELDAYEDWRLPVQDRIDDLISQMTLEEKVGLMFHPNIAVSPDGVVKYDLTDEEKAALAGVNETYAGPIGPGGQQPAGGGMAMGQMRRTATAKDYIEVRNFRNILNNGVAEPKLFAQWSNGMQEIAEATRLGIPIMFSTDPRHGAKLGAHVSGTQYFSQWPSTEGQVGITASRNLDMMRKFGEITAQEYRAVGLHMILGPQIDVGTDPRWSRNAGAFSEDANLTSEMMLAFMEGAQGDKVGQDKILVHLKHWPGAGPHEGGGGNWLVYPGNNFDYHLIPWKAGIEAGALAAMGYYSGTYYDTLNVNYSYYISTEVLYNQLGFKGAICTDWGVVGRGPLNPRLQGKTTLKDNMEMIINAGVDQMGSETNNQLVIELVNEGKVTEERINQAASRILQWHFLLGLFENPYVDPEAADIIVQSEENQAAGYQAQLESIVLLTNKGVLPVSTESKKKVYAEGIESAAIAKYATVVDKPADADVILVRTTNSAPRTGGGFGGGFGGGAAATEIDITSPAVYYDNIKKLKATGKPVVVGVDVSGSWVVLPEDWEETVDASFILFNPLDEPLMEVVFGGFNPVGKMPFEIPATMEDVRNNLEDVPFDTNGKYTFGYGLSY